MFSYFIVIRQHMNPSLWSTFWSRRRLPFCHNLSRSSHLRLLFFFFDNPLARSSFSASAVNIYQRPVKHFRNGFKDWNHEYQTAEKTLKGCNVYLIWMLFEISYNTHYKSNNPCIHIFILNDTLMIYITVAWIYSTWPKKIKH